MRGTILQGRPWPWPKFLVSRMLTRDLFAVADLPVFSMAYAYLAP